jgi:hypothetical protein
MWQHSDVRKRFGDTHRSRSIYFAISENAHINIAAESDGPKVSCSDEDAASAHKWIVHQAASAHLQKSGEMHLLSLHPCEVYWSWVGNPMKLHRL